MATSKKRSRRTNEILARDIEVDGVTLFVSTDVMKERGQEPHLDATASIEIMGEFREPFADVRRASIAVYGKDNAGVWQSTPPACGQFTRIKPEMNGAVFIPTKQFEAAMTMVASGLLKHCHVAFSTPYRRQSFITSVSFSNEPIE
jgi:hypothetical protein